MNWTAEERFVVERWDDVTRLRATQLAVEEKIGVTIEEALRRLAPWLSEHGYLADVSGADAEFYAFRKSWCPDGQNALVRLCVGGVVPTGYRDLEHSAPYLWVYTRNIKKKGDEVGPFPRTLRRVFAERVRQRLAAAAPAWLNDDVDDVWEPLGSYLPVLNAATWRQLAMDSSRLADFTKEQFQRLFALSDAIEAALDETRGKS